MLSPKEYQLYNIQYFGYPQGYTPTVKLAVGAIPCGCPFISDLLSLNHFSDSITIIKLKASRNQVCSETLGEIGFVNAVNETCVPVWG